MKKHYIDKGKSASRISHELINVFDETVFEYSKTVYTSLINKLEKVGVPFTDEGIINIEKIYEIITTDVKGEYTGQTPETGLPSIVLTVTNISPRILLSPKIKAELDEIVAQYFIQEKSYHGSLSDPRRALLLDEGRKLLFYSNDKLDPEKILSKITRIVSSKSLIPKPKHYTEISESGYDTDDIEDYEVDEDNRILIDEEKPLLMRYIESNMVIGATNLIKRTGVDVNTKDEYGRSALFYANSLDAITMLLGQGADVNIIDKFGNNILHIWARKSLLTPMSHRCRDQIFGSFVDKLTIPQGEEEGAFSLVNHKGQDVRYMFLLGSQYFHLSAEKRLPDIYDYNSLCSFVRNKISSPMKGSCNAYIPETVLDIILSYLNMPINDLSLEDVLS